jgi:hypothetical protein
MMKEVQDSKPFALLVAVLAFFCMSSCKEDVDDTARYVFSEHTIVSYLEKYSDVYGEYLNLINRVQVSTISKTTVGQLLTARGHYTVFAPTNEAVQDYLVHLVDTGLIARPSWDAFTDSLKLDSIRKVIVYNSIIDCGDLGEPYFTYDLPSVEGAEIGTTNMNDHKLSVYWKGSEDSLCINSDCHVSVKNRDITLLNGVLHQVEKVIAPQDITARNYLQGVIDEQRQGFLVMARAIQACGLMDTLNAIRDEVYETLYQTGRIDPYLDCNTAGMGNYIAYTPQHRKYGFTIFAESDEFWRSQGIDPLDPELPKKLMQWILDNRQYAADDSFTTDEDYASEDNLLYQWTTYHILPVRLTADRLVIHQNEIGYNMSVKKLANPVIDYQVTMGRRRLMKLYESKYSDGVRLNRFPRVDNGRTGSNDETGCDPDKVGNLVNRDPASAVLNDMINCCIYTLDSPLSYNDEVRDNFHRERIRFDAMMMWPETTNSDIRKKELTHSNVNNEQFAYIPPRSVYPYLDGLWLSDDCHFRYTNFWGANAPNLFVDEILCTGRFEIMFRLPPVPRRGTYELRYVCLSQASRSIAQIYFGDDPDRLPVVGIPFDFRADVTARHIGAQPDTDDEDYNTEMDKQLRNKGYMKGAKSVCGSGNVSASSRYDNRCYRRIMLTQFMDPDKTYYLKAKTVLETDQKEFFLDYLEFCPKEVYDNPESPEDIW